MTKEEKIKEAWGEYWDSLTEKARDRALRSDGYVFHQDLAEELLKGEDAIYLQFKGINASNISICRPQSLKGIEDNNGWIKIESEEDLPKDEEEGYFSSGIMDEKGRFKQIKRDYLATTLKSIFQMEKITHWKPIVKPKPPIY